MFTWADLSYVPPMTASAYAFTAILGKFFLGEQISAERWAGTLSHTSEIPTSACASVAIKTPLIATPLSMPMCLDFDLALCGCVSPAVLHQLGAKPLPQAPI
jgi:hypothetical protein